MTPGSLEAEIFDILAFKIIRIEYNVADTRVQLGPWGPSHSAS
jgi:hypothetical protein